MRTLSKLSVDHTQAALFLSHQSHFTIGINPLVGVEPHLPIGASLGIRFSPRVELWQSFDYLTKGFYATSYNKGTKGFRYILQPRWYTGYRKMFFIAGEFRYRQYSIIQESGITNGIDTVAIQHRSTQIVPGGAIVFGKKFILNRKANWLIEVFAGIGAKQRIIHRKNIPAGYTVVNYRPLSFALAPNFDDEIGMPYFPIGMRIAYVFSKKD
ncbi:MAG: hypothetical protein ACOYKE_15355 [Ferruginibacter sp.]